MKEGDLGVGGRGDSELQRELMRGGARVSGDCGELPSRCLLAN